MTPTIRHDVASPSLAAGWRLTANQLLTAPVWGTTAVVGVVAIVLAAVLLRGVRPAEAPASPAPDSGLAVACTGGRDLHVSVDGLATNPGTEEAPLDLETALIESGPLRPCDTAWLHPGTYRGTFTSTLKGESGRPIVVRARSDDGPVVIDSAPSSSPALTVRGTHTWFWGLEIMNSAPERHSTEASNWPTDLPRGNGISAGGTYLKFINLMVHDVTRGFEIGAEASNVEIYGSVIYNNGWEGPEASNGHGIVTQNSIGTQRLRDNVIFNQFSHGILALSSETARVDHLLIEGNIVFENGRVGRSGLARDILVGGGRVVEALVLRDNATWGDGQTFVGYGSGCSNGVITGNYLVGSNALLLADCVPELSGNTLVSQYGFASLPSDPSNTYAATRPTGTVIRVRPNEAEPGMSLVAVYNWDRHDTVALDGARLGLAQGDAFEILDLQHGGRAPVLSGTLGASPITLSMAVRPTLAPTGLPQGPPSTHPDFGVFVVRKVQTAPADGQGPPT